MECHYYLFYVVFSFAIFPLPTSTPPPSSSPPRPSAFVSYIYDMYLNPDSTCGRKHLGHIWQSSPNRMVPTPTHFPSSDVTAVFTAG